MTSAQFAGPPRTEGAGRAGTTDLRHQVLRQAVIALARQLRDADDRDVQAILDWFFRAIPGWKMRKEFFEDISRAVWEMDDAADGTISDSYAVLDDGFVGSIDEANERVVQLRNADIDSYVGSVLLYERGQSAATGTTAYRGLVRLHHGTVEGQQR